MAAMIEKQEVQELFPTPIWIVDLQPATATVLNAQLKAEKGEGQTVLAAIASVLPLPAQRRLNQTDE